MSGTSLDGVNAVLAEIDGRRCEVRATHYRPFPRDLVDALLALHAPGYDELHRAALIAGTLAELYAGTTQALLAQTSFSPNLIRAIGCHGQTIRHQPGHGYTLQLGNAALLAELTGITVISDFRSRDIAAGGQGAPLVPAFHDALFRVPDVHRGILNLGGIANLTRLAPDIPTSGFDCGPGNMLLDGWVQARLGKSYDAGGQWAASGRCLPALLERLLQHPFFLRPPPKSCGREEFGMEHLLPLLSGEEDPADVQATLVELTVTGIAGALRQWISPPEELYVCGGGGHNTFLLERLSAQLPETRIALTDALGLPADWVEAAAFAWLAAQTLDGQPGNLPDVTGARGPRVLGAIHPA